MEAAQSVGFMIRIQSGLAALVPAVANDGIGHARTAGLFLSASSRTISVYDSYVPQALLGIPVALIVNPEQAALQDSAPVALAQAGTVRRIFLSQEQAML